MTFPIDRKRAPLDYHVVVNVSLRDNIAPTLALDDVDDAVTLRRDATATFTFKSIRTPPLIRMCGDVILED